MLNKWLIAFLVCACIVVLNTSASAALVKGDLLGVFSGNDSESQLLADLGLIVDELAKVDPPTTTPSGGLALSALVLNDDNEPVSGEWTYTGLSLVDILVVKAGSNYAAYRYTDANTGNMRNMGLWDTLDLPTNGNNPKGASHITAYRIVPEPSTLLMTMGISILGLRRRRPTTR